MTDFTPPIVRTRLRNLLSAKVLFCVIPLVTCRVRLVLKVCLVRLTSARILFTLRTCDVTWLGRKILRLLIPLLMEVNTTGVLAVLCMDRVVFLWVLLLSPARTILLILILLRNVVVAVIVLRLTTVLTIRSSLLGRIVLWTVVVRFTSLLLTVSWFVALTTIRLRSDRLVHLRELWVIIMGLLMLPFGRGVQYVILVCLVMTRNRPIVPGCRRLVVIRMGRRFPPVRRPVSPFVSAAPFVFRRLSSTTIAGGPPVSSRPWALLLRTLTSLLRMTPMIRRVGPRSADILVFAVCLCISEANACIIGSDILVLSRVPWTLWIALLTLVLDSWFPLCRFPKAVVKWLDREPNTYYLRGWTLVQLFVSCWLLKCARRSFRWCSWGRLVVG